MQRVGHVSMRGVLATVVVAGALLALPVAACAVTVVKSTNGIIITPETGVDLGTVPQVKVYYDYKGGTNFSATYPPFNTGSYNNSELVIASSTLYYDLLEVPLKTGYRIQRVEIASQKADNSGASTIYSVVLNEPLKVAQQGAVEISSVSSLPTVTANIHSMPDVSLDGTISAALDQTIPVDISATEGLPEGWPVVAYTVLLLSFGGGLAFVIVGKPWQR